MTILIERMHIVRKATRDMIRQLRKGKTNELSVESIIVIIARIIVLFYVDLISLISSRFSSHEECEHG